LNEIADSIDGVVVTNVFGLQTDVLAYETWCKDNGKLLVFDNAATSVGLTRCGRSIHDVGDGAFVSLHETKPIGRGEGGAIFVRPELVEFVVRATNFGFSPPRLGMPRAGHRGCSNWKMSDIAAAAILPHLDAVIETGWVARYEAAVSFATAEAQLYGFSLEPIPGLSLKFPTVLACLLVALPMSCHGKVDQVIAVLDAHAEAKHYYYPLVEPSKAPVAWQLFNSTICLPFHLDMTQDDIAFMFEKLSRAVAHATGQSARSVQLKLDQHSIRAWSRI
jgi:dTDP-4-amino-4,6-dideoxygalactose transaminase